MTAKVEERNIEVEDALRCRLIVAREATLDNAIDVVNRVAAVKRKRACRTLIVSDLSDLNSSVQGAAESSILEDDEFLKAVSKNARRLTKIIIMNSPHKNFPDIENKLGVPVSFMDGQEALSVEFESLSTQAAIVGVVYCFDNRIPTVLDSVFGTMFLFESPSAHAEIVTPYLSDVGSTIMIGGQGVSLQTGGTNLGSVCNLTDDVHGVPLAVIGNFSLSERAFSSAILSSSIRAIGRAAFFRCTRLQFIKLSSSLDFIGRSAFEDCTSLESLTIPSGCRSISRYAFRNCSSLKTVKLPSSLSSIGYSAFSGCHDDLTFQVIEGSYAHSWATKNAYTYTIVEDVRLATSAKLPRENFKHKIYLFKPFSNGRLEIQGFSKKPKQKDLGNFEIPSVLNGHKVVSIAARAFAGNTHITTVNLPEGLQWVAPEAFAGCTALSEIHLPQSIRVIGRGAFAGCPGFKSDFEDYSFSFNEEEVTIERYHGSSTEVEVPSEVMGLPVAKLAPYCFKDEWFLQSVILPDSVREIGTKAFAGCPNLSQVRIPSSVKSIGSKAFDHKVPLAVESGSDSHIWAVANGNPINFCDLEKGDSVHFAFSQHQKLPLFTRGPLTIEKICELIDVELPAQLIEKKDMVLPGANAYWTVGRRYEAYFDLLNEEEAIEGALKNKPSLLVLGEPFVGDTQGVPVIIHPNPAKAFERVCQWRLEAYKNLEIVGVGGSQGKTSMKDFIATVLGGHGMTVKSAGNTNTLSGLDHALRKLTPNHRFYVQEVGAGGYHGRFVEAAAAAIRPHFAVLTNIRDNHLEVYGTRERILEVKSSLIEEIREGGIAFLNADDEMLLNYKTDKPVVYFGVENEQADYRAENVKTQDGSITFTIVNKGRRIPARINIIGEYNVYNALAAFAIGEAAGIGKDDIIRYLKRLEPQGMRQNYTTIAGYQMYIDCYNSSPDSVKQGLEVIAGITLPRGTRRIVVLGDILELGDEEIDKHKALADALEKHKDSIDLVICYGPLSAYTAKEAVQKGLTVLATEDRAELSEFLKQNAKEGDLIYWKASHGMRLFQAIDELVGTSYDINDQTTVNVHGERIETEDAKVTLMPQGAQIDEWVSDKQEVSLPLAIEGIPLVSIKRNAFVDASDLTSIDIPFTVEHIGFGAFFQNSNLRVLNLSEGLRMIDRSAFNGCDSLEKVIIPNSCKHIGARAFYGCTSLKDIFIPPDVATIDEQAFEGCPDLEITCMPNSRAEEYAIQNSIEYSFLGTKAKAGHQ